MGNKSSVNRLSVPQYFKIISGYQHRDFTYQIGPNKLSDNGEEFNSYPICGPGGLYYTKSRLALRWINYGHILCKVKIPANAKVVAMDDKFKADEIHITSMYDLRDPDTFKFLIENGVDIHIDDELPLQWASKNGYTDVVKFLIENGADIHANDNFALREASCNGHYDIVKLLIENNANIHAYNDYALRWASCSGHYNTVKLLIENGANVHAANDAALLRASYGGHYNTVKLLIENGANIHADCDLALKWASKKGHYAVVKLLIENGANVHADGVVEIAKFNKHLEIIELLKEHGAVIPLNVN